MTAKLDVLKEVSPDVYASEMSGRTMTRGTDKDFTANGNPLKGIWVLREKDGTFIDYHQYRNDLACQNKFTLTR